MKMQQEVGYVAGPYRADTENKILCNIRRAEAVSIALWRKGYSNICPHKNTSFLGGVVENDQVWLDGDLLMMIRCDFLVLVEGWTLSSGTCSEIEKALEYDIPVYTSISAFEDKTHLKRKLFNKLRVDQGKLHVPVTNKLTDVAIRIKNKIEALSGDGIVLQDSGRARVRAFQEVLKMIGGK